MRSKLRIILITASLMMLVLGNCAAAPTDEFSMVFMSDPQLGYGNNYDNNSLLSVFVHSWAGALGCRGIVITGDLTNEGKSSQLEDYKKLFDPFPLPPIVFPGFGNHDLYANEIEYMISSVQGLPLRNNFYLALSGQMGKIDNVKNINFDCKIENARGVRIVSGSLAYSWDIGNIHFVQTNVMRYIPVSWSEGSTIYTIWPCINGYFGESPSYYWLENDLYTARKQGKSIILLLHDPDEHWAGDKRLAHNQFDNLTDKYSVSAIFFGHLHPNGDRCGYYTHWNRGKENGTIPLFNCGSSQWNTFLTVSFGKDTMKVKKYQMGFPVAEWKDVKLKHPT